MVADAILRFVHALLERVFGGWTDAVPGVPGWVQTGADGLQTGIDGLYAFDTWIPVTFALSVLGTVLSIWVVALVIQAVRTVISYFTFGGGAS